MHFDFNDLVEQYLEECLPQHMATSIDFEKLPSDTKLFIRRMLVLMKKSIYGVHMTKVKNVLDQI